MLVFRSTELGWPELVLARTEVGKEVICQSLYRLQCLLVASLFIYGFEGMEHEVELVGIHTADRALSRTVALGCSTEIAVRLL